MPTTVNLRKTLDRKQWESTAPIPIAAVNAQQLVAKSQLWDQLVMMIQGSASPTFYRPDEDAWVQVGGGVVGSGAGAGLCHHPNGPTGTASAGTSTTLTTTTTVAVNLASYTIRITAGTGAGQERTISSATLGANSVVTVSVAWGVTPDNTSVYLLLTGKFWLNPSSGSGTRSYDVATNTWSSALAIATTITADGCLLATPGYYGQTGLGTGMATGTATSGSATTVVNTAKAWATNQWANYQVRITAGTGAGKVATITSNTGTTLTFPTVTTVLDSTSVYIIEGNDDFLYALGGNAVTLQRYSISGNTWTTLTPGTVRTNAPGPGAGTTACWASACTDSLFSAESAILNGRRIYSFNSLSSVLCLDYYDIPSNAWVNAVAVGRLFAINGFSALGTSGTLVGDNWYVAYGGVNQAAGAGQVWRINLPRQTLDPWSAVGYPAAAANTSATGQRIFDASYTDGGTTIRWIYVQALGTQAWFRCMVI